MADPDLTKLNFWSGANYMKRGAATNFQDVVVGSGATVLVPPVTHGLGYIPEADASAELAGDGVIWSNNLPYVGMENGSGTEVACDLEWWVTTTTFAGTLTNNTGHSITVRVYYTIYKDYGNV